MRIRSLKPEWLHDELLAAECDSVRLLSIALILMADDYGNGRGSEVFVAGQVWAYSPKGLDEVSKTIRESLARLSRIGFIQIYAVRGQQYYSICNWSKHQRVDKPGKPLVPGPDQADASRESRESLRPDQDQDQDQDLSCSPPVNRSDQFEGKTSPLRFDFESVYAQYPKKRTKSKGMLALKRKVKTQEDFDLLTACVTWMAKAWRGEDTQFCPGWAPFANQERWLDEEWPGPNGKSQRRKQGGGEFG